MMYHVLQHIDMYDVLNHIHHIDMYGVLNDVSCATSYKDIIHHIDMYGVLNDVSYIMLNDVSCHQHHICAK